MNDSVNLKAVLDEMNYSHNLRKSGKQSSRLGDIQKGIIDAFVFSVQNGNLNQQDADLFVTNLVTDSSILGLSKQKGKANDCYGMLDYLAKSYQKVYTSLENEMSGKIK